MESYFKRNIMKQGLNVKSQIKKFTFIGQTTLPTLQRNE